MSLKKYLVLLLISTNLFALDFVPGSGSQFVMISEGQKVDLNIYVANRSDNTLGIEMHFGAGGLFAVNMWQQFVFKLSPTGGPLIIEKGFIKTSAIKKPEVMTDEFFKQNEGVQVQDFLFSKKEEINKFLIGEGQVELPAGSVKAKHYRKKNLGQTVDFWISESVGPISLVKLVSKSEKVKTNNYTIELASLLKNVKASIDPKKAVPLTKDTAEILKKNRK